MKTVGVIGGSGFIGSYVTRVFLDNGFEVKVSVTDIGREDKYKHLKDLNYSANLSITEMNVTDKAALRDFVAGCNVVIHGGTPFILDVQDPEKELFEPTVKGTEHFLEVIKNTPGLEKVVFIASVASFNTHFPMPPEGKTPFDPIDENDRKFISPESHPYGQAKFLANQVVEKFIADHPDLPFEITSVAPVVVMGSALSGRADSTSIGFQFLFKNKIAPNPFVQMLYDTDLPFAVVDVEDVAQAIYLAATTPGLHGRNYLLSSQTYKVSDLNLMLNRQEPLADGLIVYGNALAINDLGVRFRPVKDTLNSYSG
jgi:dihydroflavonol-4-reductase